MQKYWNYFISNSAIDIYLLLFIIRKNISLKGLALFQPHNVIMTLVLKIGLVFPDFPDLMPI